MRQPLPALILAATALTACARVPMPEIAYDDRVPALAPPPAPVVDQPPRAVHTPPAWTPARGGDASAATTEARILAANAAARVEPRREGYYNALQVFPWSEGALYQVHAAPGQITTLALEPGERLTGPGPIAAGDTARWIIGDTTSGTGRTARVHILVNRCLRAVPPPQTPCPASSARRSVRRLRRPSLRTPPQGCAPW